jgi:hypothetical protein
MAQCGTRLVRFLEILDLPQSIGLWWPLDAIHQRSENLLMLIDRTDQILQFLHAGSANNRRRDTVLAHTPGDGNLRHADPTLLGDLFHASLIKSAW